MKKFKLIILSITFLATGLALQSCGTGTSDSANTEKQGKEYTSAYICPMHCAGSGSEEAGQCPTCGMDYVKNENYEADGHEGHSH